MVMFGLHSVARLIHLYMVGRGSHILSFMSDAFQPRPLQNQDLTFCMKAGFWRHTKCLYCLYGTVYTGRKSWRSGAINLREENELIQRGRRILNHMSWVRCSIEISWKMRHVTSLNKLDTIKFFSFQILLVYNSRIEYFHSFWFSLAAADIRAIACMHNHQAEGQWGKTSVSSLPLCFSLSSTTFRSA